MGVIKTVDVSDISCIMLRYEDRYDVKLGDASQLERKIGYMKSAIAEEGQYETGRIDVSFEIFSNEAYVEHPKEDSDVKNEIL